VRYEQMAGEVLSEQSAEPGAAEAGIETDARWFRNLTRALAVVYLTTHRQADDDGQLPVVDSSTPEPDTVVMDRETGEKLRELIAALPEDEKTLIEATYFAGLTLQAAGKRLGVSKSWASRLHAKTLQRLARSLKLMGIAI
jgi:RNA polymerase sigma factor for flagellar operon FliA